jgi:pimeloyl-ACP methyl ester carboxylesterase
VELAVAEASDPAPGDRATALDRGVIAYVRWMVIHHAGFVPAFMSCIRYAPLTDQHDSWREVAKRPKGTTAVFLGKSDDLIVAADYAEDALPLLGGEENVTWKLLPGGHDFVMTHADEIVKELDEFWGMKAPA